MKVIVTHFRPDLDAATSAWMVYSYLPGWSNAEFRFVGAGSTLDQLPPDDNENVIHVDTGLGKFDHHQFHERTSASKRVFDYLTQERHVPKKDKEALERLVEFATLIDNFGEINFPNANDDVYVFLLSELIEGVKAKEVSDEEVMKYAFTSLEAALQLLKNKVHAEQDVKTGFVFQSSFGKSLAMETKNEEAIKLALKNGYKLVIRKDPEKNYARLKTPPDDTYDLTPVYEQIKKRDKKGTWFLHASKNMLLNGSSKNPHATPTILTLQQLIEIVKKI